MEVERRRQPCRFLVIVMLVDVLARFASLCNGARGALTFLSSVWSLVYRNQGRHVFEYPIFEEIQFWL